MTAIEITTVEITITEIGISDVCEECGSEAEGHTMNDQFLCYACLQSQCEELSEPKKELVMKFTKSAYDSIMETVGTEIPESGGILLGSREDFVVTKFHLDEYGSCSPGGYDPDIELLNLVLKRENEKTGNRLLGFVHSHPRGVRKLSGDYGDGIGDQGYIERFFEHLPSLEKFLVPIVFSSSDGHKQDFIPYIAERGNVENYREARLEIDEKYD